MDLIKMTRLVSLSVIGFLRMKYFFMPLHVVLKILEMCLSSSRTKNVSFIFISRIYHLYFRTKKNKRWGKILFSVVHNIIVNQTKRIPYKLYFNHILMIYEHITKNKRTLSLNLCCVEFNWQWVQMVNDLRIVLW